MKLLKLIFFLLFFIFYLNNVYGENSKVDEISKNLRCLICQGQSIYDSQSEFALSVKTLISKKLEKKGFYVVPIRPPSVPINSSRLRISVSSAHSQNDIKKLFNSLKLFKNRI